uniref:Lon N-terminal domain-containing protein n=1 Tax=Chrysotila carterae TaxID=13221 RepID=A0A7S4C4Z2_CHRCT|mmetsp:Transcript_7228/g.16030  ORF Transcript_7228/g.16030 Transcript_7228/m.16030 type:complete len:429 (+) Transcript_7228:139-1425(+)
MLQMGRFCQLWVLLFIFIASQLCNAMALFPTGVRGLRILQSGKPNIPQAQHTDHRPGYVKNMGCASGSARCHVTLSATEWLAASTAGSTVPETTSLEAFRNEAESGQKLGLLPFGVADAMLPGETKQVHLYEARFTHLFESATRNHGCLGQLLVTRDSGVAAVTSLLEVEESRRQDIGVWAQLKCVARVRLTSLEETEYDYLVGEVEMVTDARNSAQPNTPTPAVLKGAKKRNDDVGDLDPAQEIGRETDSEADNEVGLEDENEEELEAEHAAEQLRETHRSCRRLALACKQLADEDAGADERTQGPDEQLTEIVQWGHEARREALPFESALDEIVALRRDAILSRGPDAAPASSLIEQVRTLWGVDTEAQAERQLLSFAATGFLSPVERAEALGMRDTVQRLQHVLTALRENERRLAAQLALRNAFR